MVKKKLRALGGDIFAGLFTVGIKRAGYEVVGHVEHGSYGVKTAQLNHPELRGRVWTHPSDWPAPGSFGHVNFMFCNPACAAWSSARGADKSDWRDQSHRLLPIEHLVTYGIELGPDAWCWESVTNAWRHGRPFMDRIAESWLDAGYHVTVLKQNNMYMGVAQDRPRVFVIAHKYPLVFPQLTAPMTVKEAWKGLRPTKAELAEASIDEGLGWKPLWESAATRPTLRTVYGVMTREEQKTVRAVPNFFTRRLKLDKPAPVLMSNHRARLHPTEYRKLTWREALALCGLPLDWQRSNPIGSAYVELTRAVMPPVGEWLGRAVADGLGKRWPKDVRGPRYQVVHMDAGPDKIYVETLDPDGDRTMGSLEPWHLVEPPASRRKATTPTKG